MDAIAQWWNGLTALNQWFYIAAAFLSIFFLWQLIAALIGLGVDHGGFDHDLTSQVDTLGDHGVADDTAAHDAADTVEAFRLLSYRSALAFLTLFTWAGALYLNDGSGVTWALLRSLLWGLAGMAIVAGLLHLLRRLTETGNINLTASLGVSCTVYVNIPADGDGEVRVLVSGVVRTVRARASGGRELKAGATAYVCRVLGPNLVEVEPG